MIWVRAGRQGRGLARLVCDGLLEGLGEDRDDEDDDREHDHHRRGEDVSRVEHGRSDLSLQRIQLLELEGDSLQRIVEPPRALARSNHGAEELVEDLRSPTHCVGQGAARLDVVAHPCDRVLEPLVLRLVFERVQRPEHRHAGGDQGRELPGEDREVAGLDRAEAIEGALQLESLVLLRDVEHDQPALAELLGDLSLRLGVHLPPGGHTAHIDGTEGVGAHLRLRSSSPPGRPRPTEPALPRAAA
jgi:hypothetical protein